MSAIPMDCTTNLEIIFHFLQDGHKNYSRQKNKVFRFTLSIFRFLTNFAKANS